MMGVKEKMTNSKLIPEIRIENLYKTFVTNKGQEVAALRDINIDIYSNNFICLVGPSGCGKSTLLRIVAGLEKASSGNAIYKNKKIDSPSSKIGLVFQEYSLLPWRTVLENVGLGLEFKKISFNKIKKIAGEYLELVGLSQFAGAYPYELSGGMQQRVAIARALANDPEVLLMDEPFGALDAHTRILLQKELLRIWEKNRKTIVFVTHSVDEAIYLADRIIVMSSRPGKIKQCIDIEMPRPRNRANPLYGKMSEQILDMLEEESSLATPLAELAVN